MSESGASLVVCDQNEENEIVAAEADEDKNKSVKDHFIEKENTMTCKFCK